jgi:MFS family permease
MKERKNMAKSDLEGSYQVYRYRWVNLLVSSLIGFGIGFAILGPTVLVSSVAKEWSVSFTQSTIALVLLGGLALGVLGLPAGIASDKWGFKLPLVSGATVASIGLLLRGSASTWNMFLLFNAITAIGAGFTMSGIGTLVRKWFPLEEVGQANGLSMIMTPVGTGAGMAVAFPLIDSVGWEQMWMIFGIVYTAVTILGWVLLRENPPSPPGPIQPQSLVKSSGLIHEAKTVMNRTNILLLIVFIAVTGLISMAPAILPVTLGVQNLPANTIGLVLAALNFVGLPAMALIPGWAFRKGLSKLSMTVAMFAAGLSFIIIFYLRSENENIWIIMLLVIIAGVALAASIPIAMSMAMCQPGVHPGNVGILYGLIMTVMGLGRLILPPVVGGLVDNVGMKAGAWALAILLFVAGFILLVFIPEEKSGTQPIKSVPVKANIVTVEKL